jgi:hypothetical protein
MLGWDLWKKGFDAWEGATAQFAEKAMKNPLLLGPSGAMLKAVMQAKAGSDKATARGGGGGGGGDQKEEGRESGRSTR